MMFKEGVRPEWEDEGNLGGGMWKMVIPNKLRAEQLDKMWLETLLSMIGEYYADLGDLICGAYREFSKNNQNLQQQKPPNHKNPEIFFIFNRLNVKTRLFYGTFTRILVGN